MSSETLTVEITNSIADLREFTITDAYYENMPVADGTISLTSS